MVVVLCALPLQSLADDSRAEAERSIRELYASVVARAIVEGLGSLDRIGSRSWQLVVSAALRLQYGLARAPVLRVEILGGGDLAHTMLDYVSSEAVIPEVVVETVRSVSRACA